MPTDASATSGRECIYFQTNAFDSMVVPDSMEPGSKKAYSSYDEYYKAERTRFEKATYSSGVSWARGDEAKEIKDWQADQESKFAARMNSAKESGLWQDAKRLEEDEKSRGIDKEESSRSTVETKDANKFEEKRANISLASSTALTMATSSANLQRQNVMRSIAGGDNIV